VVTILEGPSPLIPPPQQPSVWVKDTFECRVQRPPQLSRQYVVALAYEKVMRSIERKGWTPVVRTFQVVWLDTNLGVALCEAVKEKRLTPSLG
jgi:hypothetical protein